MAARSKGSELSTVAHLCSHAECWGCWGVLGFFQLTGLFHLTQRQWIFTQLFELDLSPWLQTPQHTPASPALLDPKGDRSKPLSTGLLGVSTPTNRQSYRRLNDEVSLSRSAKMTLAGGEGRSVSLRGSTFCERGGPRVTTGFYMARSTLPFSVRFNLDDWRVIELLRQRTGLTVAGVVRLALRALQERQTQAPARADAGSGETDSGGNLVTEQGNNRADRKANESK